MSGAVQNRRGTVFPCPTNANFTGKKYLAVAMNTAGTDADLIEAGTAPALGLLQDDAADFSGTTTGRVSVVVEGPSLAIAGAAFNANVLLMPGTGGKLIAATTGKHAIALSLQAAGADGDEVNVLVIHGYQL